MAKSYLRLSASRRTQRTAMRAAVQDRLCRIRVTAERRVGQLASQATTQLTALLEADLPANAQSAKNQRLQGRLERDVTRYFRDMEKAMPASKLAAVYNALVKE